MKLYDAPNKTWIKLPNGSRFFFDHIDGMYSYCTTEDGKITHLAAWTEVEVCDE